MVTHEIGDVTDCHPMCGERCMTCNERMCATYGPEPRACGVVCADCPDDCTSCLQVRHELRADLERRIAGEVG